jgi:predicted O-methyltransferase YrrM
VNRIKRLVKAIVPRSMLSKVVETRNWIGLATLRKRKFDSSNLRAADAISLVDVWENKEIGAEWEKDYSTIKYLYGHQDMMEGVNPGDRRALYYLIMALKPQNVLEVGTHIGASTLYIARALKRLNRNGRITTVDIIDVNHPTHGLWKKLGLKKSPAEFARELECLDLIDFHTQPSIEFMDSTRRHFDFVFLDGYHGARTVYEEVGAALRLLDSEGVVLLHDYYPRGKALYPRELAIGGPFYALHRIRKENLAIDVLHLAICPGQPSTVVRSQVWRS